MKSNENKTSEHGLYVLKHALRIKTWMQNYSVNSKTKLSKKVKQWCTITFK